MMRQNQRTRQRRRLTGAEEEGQVVAAVVVGAVVGAAVAEASRFAKVPFCAILTYSICGTRR